jgi:hypothetical protein
VLSAITKVNSVDVRSSTESTFITACSTVHEPPEGGCIYMDRNIQGQVFLNVLSVLNINVN